MKKRTFKIVTMRYDVDDGELVECYRCEYIQKNFKEYFYSRLKYTNKEVIEENETILYIPYIEYNNQIFLYRQKPDCNITEDNIYIAVMMGLIYIPCNDLLVNIENWGVEYKRYCEMQRNILQGYIESKRRGPVILSAEEHKRLLDYVFSEEFHKKMRYIENNKKSKR